MYTEGLGRKENLQCDTQFIVPSRKFKVRIIKKQKDVI
jgi:hypothetical protein